MRAGLRRVVAPAADVVTLAEAKQHCRIDDSDSDAILAVYIASAIAFVDGLGMLGRAMVRQTWEQTQAQPSGKVNLEIGPAIDLTEIRYYDADDVEQTATLTDFRMITVGDRSYVEPKPGNAWPGASDRPDAVTVQFRAGYGETAAAVPAPLRVAVMMLVYHQFEMREPLIVGASVGELPLGIRELIGLYRVSWYG